MTKGGGVTYKNAMKHNGNEIRSQRLLTTKEAAELWGLGLWTLREMVKRGEIKRVMGLRTKEFRFRPDAFDKFLKNAA